MHIDWPILLVNSFPNQMRLDYMFRLFSTGSGPTCSCFNVGNNIELTCSADFADCTINPIPAIITWVINGTYYATDTPAKNKTDAYVYTATSTITLEANTVYDYECVLTFGEPTDIQYEWIASNAPAFNESCSTYC